MIISHCWPVCPSVSQHHNGGCRVSTHDSLVTTCARTACLSVCFLNTAGKPAVAPGLVRQARLIAGRATSRDRRGMPGHQHPLPVHLSKRPAIPCKDRRQGAVLRLPCQRLSQTTVSTVPSCSVHCHTTKNPTSIAINDTTARKRGFQSPARKLSTIHQNIFVLPSL